mmetsp:Transcript_79137/g.191755  ORF Transcript_79137/g.191755 Transcript_79137/m.191755 type:complete len:239 (-) Transcript_79137:648-1364(-)
MHVGGSEEERRGVRQHVRRAVHRAADRHVHVLEQRLPDADATQGGERLRHEEGDRGRVHVGADLPHRRRPRDLRRERDGDRGAVERRRVGHEGRRRPHRPRAGRRGSVAIARSPPPRGAAAVAGAEDARGEEPHERGARRDREGVHRGEPDGAERERERDGRSRRADARRLQTRFLRTPSHADGEQVRERFVEPHGEEEDQLVRRRGRRHGEGAHRARGQDRPGDLHPEDALRFIPRL